MDRYAPAVVPEMELRHLAASRRERIATALMAAQMTRSRAGQMEHGQVEDGRFSELAERSVRAADYLARALDYKAGGD
jgi:hypothetical protein